ncbi:MAG TPA: hypothetical protein G4O08_03655 [Anaerolineae bacterium]|nr:hypothetical protein [Anaerolineae bacterium]
MSRISISLVALSGLLGACTGNVQLLPNPVYFRYGPQGHVQIWRLETDGVTTVQLTDEAFGVDEFTVSMADGSLAFVSNNQLFLVDGNGENRRLIADGNQVDPETQDYVFRGFVEAPVFSPDGETLAYAFDGLHLYTIDTGVDEHVLTNLGNLLGEPFVFDRENYYPGPWSPEGDMLLIIMSYFEGSTLAVLEPGNAEPFRRLWSDGAVCCTYHWAADGASVFVANSSYDIHEPGLWEYDVETGVEFDLITGQADSPQYVGWPVQLPSGDLIFFHGERFSPDEGIPLTMMRSDADGSNRVQVRPESFHIREALRAEDASLVLLTQSSDRGTVQLVLVYPDERPQQLLLEGDGFWDLAWGP